MPKRTGERIATAAPTCRILTTAANFLLPLPPFSLAIVFLDSNIDIKAAILVGMVHLSALQGGSASCLASSIREAISAKKGATISRVDTLADNVAILTGESHLHFAISLQGSAAAC